MVTLKLNGTDVSYVLQLIRDTDTMVHQKDFRMMVQANLVEIAEKLHRRSFWLDQKASIKLSASQAIAFKVHFSMIQIDDPYGNMLLKKLVAVIDQALINQTISHEKGTNSRRLHAAY